ncbi:hypothetical protein P167DRAFT_478030, partial [Morchella conica CCBAS932]
ANNPKVIKDFFKKLHELIRKHHILPENTYNMDEKGFLMGQGRATRVICQKGKKRNFKVHDGDRSLITVLETVSAVGDYLPPTIVYKGV